MRGQVTGGKMSYVQSSVQNKAVHCSGEKKAHRAWEVFVRGGILQDKAVGICGCVACWGLNLGTANAISHPRAAMSRRSQRHRPPHRRNARAVAHSNPIHLHATRSQPGLCADTRASVPSSMWTCSVSFCTSCSFEYMIRDMTSAFFPSQPPPPLFFFLVRKCQPV